MVVVDPERRRLPWDDDTDIDLFKQLPGQGLAGRFAILDVAARKIPLGRVSIRVMGAGGTSARPTGRGSAPTAMRWVMASADHTGVRCAGPA